jgi:thiol:disulfide interchange protein DsbD
MGISSTLGAASVLAIAAALTAASPARAGGPPDPKDLVKAELVAETKSVVPASTLWVDLRLAIKPGWHIYWLNPGDSGLPTTIDWQLPAGFSAGDIRWPVPEHFVRSDVGNYGYAGSADLLVPITVQKEVAVAETAVLAAEASWLACAEICIPGGVRLSLSLPVAERPAASDPSTAALFASVRRDLPLPAKFETSFVATSHDYRLRVPESALEGMHDPTAAFFPNDGAPIDHAAETITNRTADGLEVVLKKAAATAITPAKLDGVLALHGESGTTRAFEISASPASVQPVENSLAGWQALLLAFLGGIVLNMMPCVFPILSLKLLSLAGQAHRNRAEQLGHGLAYTAGVLLSFAALGGVLLALRTGGHAIGWGYQLQTPVFVAVLAYLLFAMGLSLSGVADFGALLAGTGGDLAGRSGLAGTFFTGVLATIVATPCTAPFMAAALGFALLAPTALALGIFLALGFGLAAPYLTASVVPGWQRLLPRPGGWMELVKQLLAFPLYGTVAWLAWVLIQETGPGQSLAALFGLVMIGFAVWVYGRTRLAAPRGRRLGTGLAIAGTAAAIFLVASLTNTEPERSSLAPHAGLTYEPFTAQRLSALEATGKPFFVNLTASWCVTCLINERVALDSEPVRQAFAEHGIIALKGDWTTQNPEITDLLQRFGRSGVPLYLLYSGKREPVVLPQILTPASVLDALGKV